MAGSQVGRASKILGRGRPKEKVRASALLFFFSGEVVLAASQGRICRFIRPIIRFAIPVRVVRAIVRVLS